MSHENTPLGRKHDASARAADNILRRSGTKLEQLGRLIEETPDDTHYITSITFKVQPEAFTAILGIVKADTGEGKVIAFHSDDTLGACLVGIVNRLVNGSLQWKEDVPYAERTRKSGGDGAGGAGG
jgi:hypothetical protein